MYWETVPSAASLGLSEKKQGGIQGSISGMLAGERARDIINAEPSGIVITFTSGRMAHVILRDSQGKPSLVANFLRDTSSHRGDGLLAGLKSVLGGGYWRKDVAAARTGLCHQRGQRDVVVATPSGLFEAWDTHWYNGSVLKKQFDIGPAVFRSLNADHEADPEGLRILDFAFALDPHINTQSGETSADETWALLLLVALSGRSSLADLSLVRVDVTGENAEVLYTNSIGSRGMPVKPDGLHPKLFVSGTGDTAFVLLEQSVTVLSLAPSGESSSPDTMRPIFQDRINFRGGENYEILGYGFEDRSADEQLPVACLIMVRGFGIIRVASLLRQSPEAEKTGAVQITAKDRLEQAVFYGSMMGNPLNLVTKEDLELPVGEIEHAALDISDELLQSGSKFLHQESISLGQQLTLRTRAMDDLISILAQPGNPLFSRSAWWEMLWGAEKLAAQRSMWRVEESFRELYGDQTFLTRVILEMSDKFRTKVDAQDGEKNAVRQWFLYNSSQMERMLPFICHAVKPKRGAKQGRKMAEQLLQAGALSLAILETAFQYRDKHAGLYAFSDSVLEDGVLTAGYEGLPEFWTSSSVCYAETRNLLNFELETCRTQLQQTGLTVDSPDMDTVRKIARNSSRHLRVLGQMHRERTRWLSSQDDPKLVDEGISLEQTYAKERKWQLFKLAGIGQLEDAIALAESFQDMGALVELIIELQDETVDHNHFYHVSSTDISDVVVNESGQCADKISMYFDRFGEAWADAFFSRQISMDQAGVLFAMRKFQPFVTRFLRKSTAYSQLSWINDVLGENDYGSAAQSLEKLSLMETDVWSHHVELSFAKLATLAASEKASDHSAAAQATIDRLENSASIDTVQELVYSYILPVLHGAIDQKAAIELAIDHFGKTGKDGRPFLHERLCDTLVGVVSRKTLGVEQLIDLLTLLSRHDAGRNDDAFFLALRVLHLSDYRQRDPLYHVALQKLIWRRCMIKDNWRSLGRNVDAHGGDGIVQDTALFHTLSHCLEQREHHGSGQCAFKRLADNVTWVGVKNGSFCKPMAPSDVMGSSSELDSLSYRLPSHQRSRMMRDLEKENEILAEYIEEGKLDIWFRNILASRETTC